jgi:succinate-semialdehyde dehydrogenase/glutarate-semialdehyde dehydrogenase
MVEILEWAGAPDGLFQTLFLSNDQAAEVMAHPTIRGVTLTGSAGAGREVGAQASRALKPLVLELGGSDPFVVFEDADLERAVEVGVTSRCLNSGQSCIAAKRFLVADEVHDEFLEAFVERMKSRKVGPPTDEGVEVGPLAREDLLQRVVDQVASAQGAGARLACGGSPMEGPGFFYPPTVLTDLDPSSEAAQEEIFGPVATVYRFRGEAEALTLANGTDFGLGASLWTADRARIDRLIPLLEVGSVFVNGLVKSDPRLPFGGIKDSGLGRELGREGLLEFANTKTVWLA